MSLPFSKATGMFTLCNCIQDVYNLWVLLYVLILQGVRAEEIDFNLRLLNNLEIVKQVGGFVWEGLEHLGGEVLIEQGCHWWYVF